MIRGGNILHLPRVNLFVILSLAFYFGWLLSFPFYGPVASSAAPLWEYRGLSMPFIFSFFHALAFLFSGLFLKEIKIWKIFMFAGLGISLGVGTALPFAPLSLWPWAMALLGISSALYTLGWSHPFSAYLLLGERLKLMASVMIGSNIIYLLFNLLSRVLSPQQLLLLSTVPLWLSLPPLILLPPEGGPQGSLFITAREKRTPIPAPLMLNFCLFIAGLYLCSGLMYNVMQPFLDAAGPSLIRYRYLPYIATLLIMWRFGEQLQRYFPIYMGVSFLGLSFVSFALLYGNSAGLFLTTTLMESAFAFLDLFIWTTLGDLAFIYGAPFRIFGYALAAMLGSILAGELISIELLQMGENFRLVTALFAAAAIFLTYTVIPWLTQRMQKDLYRFLGAAQKEEESAADQSRSGNGGGKREQESLLDSAVQLLLPHQKLTPRETEIISLLLRGMTNREMAARLFISENTLKTHLKNIYPKFGVAHKRELLSLVLEEKNIPASEGKTSL